MCEFRGNASFGGPFYLQMIQIPCLLPAGKKNEKKAICHRWSKQSVHQVKNNVETKPESTLTQTW